MTDIMACLAELVSDKESICTVDVDGLVFA
jgi:hypothetical protein